MPSTEPISPHSETPSEVWGTLSRSTERLKSFEKSDILRSALRHAKEDRQAAWTPCVSDVIAISNYDDSPYARADSNPGKQLIQELMSRVSDLEDENTALRMQLELNRKSPVRQHIVSADHGVRWAVGMRQLRRLAHRLLHGQIGLLVHEWCLSARADALALRQRSEYYQGLMRARGLFGLLSGGTNSASIALVLVNRWRVRQLLSAHNASGLQCMQLHLQSEAAQRTKELLRRSIAVRQLENIFSRAVRGEIGGAIMSWSQATRDSKAQSLVIAADLMVFNNNIHLACTALRSSLSGCQTQMSLQSLAKNVALQWRLNTVQYMREQDSAKV